MTHPDPAAKITRLLGEIQAGGDRAADELLPLIYREFRALAARYLRGERKGHTLQPTALVNEAYLRLVDQKRVVWKGRTHFFAVGAQAMRRILVDHARRRQRLKRGGQNTRITLDNAVAFEADREEDILALNEAMEKLAALDPRQARVVELRFFGGLTMDEVASALDISKRTAEGDWTMARAWLHRALGDSNE